MSGPKVLLLDIETAPLEIYAWSLWDQHTPVARVKKDRSILCVTVKWLDKPGVLTLSTAGQKDVRDDSAIMRQLHKVMNKADIIITQNGNKFDLPIINGRFLVHGLGPVKPYKKIDTLLLSRRMGLISNRQEYLTQVLAPELKKSNHKRFPGDSLWIECLKGNRKAWKEMEAYNVRDVLGLEAVYKKLAPFGVGVNFDLYRDSKNIACNCGSTKFARRGYAYTPKGKFQIYHCKKCGSYYRGTKNLLKKDVRLEAK